MLVEIASAPAAAPTAASGFVHFATQFPFQRYIIEFIRIPSRLNQIGRVIGYHSQTFLSEISNVGR